MWDAYVVVMQIVLLCKSNLLFPLGVITTHIP